MKIIFEKNAFYGIDGDEFCIKIIIGRSYTRIKIYEKYYSEYFNQLQYHKKIKNEKK